jgi:DNA polymerase-3 subunit beta
MTSLIIDRETLLKPLQAVSGIVERRQTLPILSNVLIEVRSGVLSLTATDLEIQVSATAPGLVNLEDFSITVAARKLSDILRALPEQTAITLDIKDSKLFVKAGKSRFSLQTLPPTDFPRFPEVSLPTPKISFAQKDLRALFAMTQYAMAQQDIRYYLNGMFLALDGQEVTVVATDGHRLAMSKTEFGTDHPPTEVILPRKAVLELTRVLGDSDEQVILQFLPSQVRFDLGGISLVSKLIDGKFPNYQAVVPTEYIKRFKIERSTLQESLQRASILSNEKFRGVRWIVSPDKMKILCTNSEQEEAEEDLEILFELDPDRTSRQRNTDEHPVSAGPELIPPIDIGFNITYLLEVLNNISSDTVCCWFGDSNTSMLLTIPDNDRFKYVVMPMRI